MGIFGILVDYIWIYSYILNIWLVHLGSNFWKAKNLCNYNYR